MTISMKAEILVLNEPTQATGRIYALTPKALNSLFKINLRGGVACELNGPQGPIDQGDLSVINQEHVCGLVRDLYLETADGAKADTTEEAIKVVGTFITDGPQSGALEQLIKDKIPFYFSAHMVTHKKEGINYIEQFLNVHVQPQFP